MSRPLITIYRVVFGLLTLVAIAAQFADSGRMGILVPANFFSYFTIQSNIIGVAALRGAAFPTRPGQRGDGFRGAAVVYLTTTFLVFAVLLSGTDVDTTTPWVNTVVHKLFPLVVMADWLIDPPESRVTFRGSLVWLIYPLAWTGYTLVRGVMTGWYPYPFLNPANGGYATVAGYVAAIIVLGVVLCAGIVAVGNARRARISNPHP